MARVTLSGLVSDIKGSINGSTFQRSASGLTLRNKPIPVGKGSSSQQLIRRTNSLLSTAWENLTDAERLTWKNFAAFTNGSGKTNKGKNAGNTGRTQFFLVNFWCLIYSKNIVVVPMFDLPEEPFTPCPPFDTVTDNLFNYEGDLDADTQILVVRVSMPQSDSTNTTNTGFRTMIFDQVNGDTQNWATAYQSVFGIGLELERKYWISLQVVNYIKGTVSPIMQKLIKFTVADKPLILQIDTTKAGSANDTFILPCGDLGVYDAVVDWGDGIQTPITTFDSVNLTHVYAVGGVYSVRITGALNYIRFNNAGDKAKLIDIVQWGSFKPLSMLDSFNGCINLIGSFVDLLDLSDTTTLRGAFRLCAKLVADMSGFNVSVILDFTNTFDGCSLFNPDFSSWNISNALEFQAFLRDTSLSVSNYDLLLNAWSLLTVEPNITIIFTPTQYTIVDAQAARDILTSGPNNWVITDGGGI